MDESVLTRTFEMLVDRLGALEAQNALILSTRRYDDEHRAGKVHGALHGFPKDFDKGYKGPVGSWDVVVATFSMDHAVPDVYFEWLEGKARLPDDLAAQLEAAPGHAAVRGKWVGEDASFHNETCGEIGLQGAPPGRKLLSHVAVSLTRDKGVVFVGENNLIFTVPGDGPADLARVLAHFKEIVRAFDGEHVFMEKVEELSFNTLSRSTTGLYVAYLEDDFERARTCWERMPQYTREAILDGKVPLFTREVVRRIRDKVAG